MVAILKKTDILVHNFPMEPNGLGILKGEAIFDVKTLRVDKASAFYFKDGERMRKRAVDTKCHTVRQEYMQRAEVVDDKCNDDINATHFAHVLKHSFHSGGVYHMVFGAYGESEVTTSRLIKNVQN